MSQQTKNIFLDKSLWDQPWFDELQLEYQVAYILLWSECDNVGVWEPHTRKLCYRLKMNEFPIDDFFIKVNSKGPKISKLEDGSWWILDYLPFQVKTLTPNNKPHISFIEGLVGYDLLTEYGRENPGSVNYKEVYRLEAHNEIDDPEEKRKAKAAFKNLKDKGLVRPLKDSCETLARPCQDSKEKDKDINKVQEKGREKEETSNPLVIEEGDDFSDVPLVGVEDS